MKIVIIGAGFTGSLLAKALIAERNKVILIDKSPERVRSAGDQLDCTVIEADGTDLDVLEKAGIASADALVTLTGDDETNMITCSLTDAVYPNVLKIARVRNYDYYKRTVDIVRRGKDRMSENGRPVFGIDHIINPDVAAASSISRAMEIGAAGSATEIEGGYEIIVLPVAEESPLSGKKLRELAAIPEWKYLVAFVESDGETELPCGDTVLNPGDHVGILVRNSEVLKLLRFAGVISTPINRVAIFGADNIGALTVAAQEDRKKAFWRAFLKLGKTKSRELLVIDRDAELCRKLADKFPDARILNGDITDDGFLL
ncbi:MAG: NAD-binding protein, partial [Kiritimatiellae bacterium]|nr:NAD-binding protein [Kiritimatiellia bacterium]